MRRVALVALLCSSSCVHLGHEDRVVIIAATIDGATCAAVGSVLDRLLEPKEPQELPDAGAPAAR